MDTSHLSIVLPWLCSCNTGIHHLHDSTSLCASSMLEYITYMSAHHSMHLQCWNTSPTCQHITLCIFNAGIHTHTYQHITLCIFNAGIHHLHTSTSLCASSMLEYITYMPAHHSVHLQCWNTSHTCQHIIFTLPARTLGENSM